MGKLCIQHPGGTYEVDWVGICGVNSRSGRHTALFLRTVIAERDGVRRRLRRGEQSLEAGKQDAYSGRGRQRRRAGQGRHWTYNGR